MAKTWVLVAAILGSSMSFVDGTAVNVALPVMQRELQATSAEIQWVVEGYALFLSALILVGGALGDVLGRKKMFVAGIVLFAAASLACAFAPNAAVLIVARCVQGIGGALSMPESLALISASFEGDERGRAIGTWSGFASITGTAGPLIGGFLTEHVSWRGVFLINLPLAVAVVAIAVLRVPESRNPAADRTIDWTGAGLATAGLGALVYGLIALQSRIDVRGLGATLAGCAVLGAFVVAQRRARHPMMPLDLFRSPTFAIANLYTFALYAALGGSRYFIPFTLIDVQRYTPTAAGAALLPFVLIQFSFSRWSGGLVERIGARTPLVVGAIFVGLGYAAFGLPGIGGSYWTTYFPASLLLGIGGVCFIAPLTTTVFAAAGRERSGIASGVNNAIARTSGLVAIAVFGIALSAVFGRSFDAQLGRESVGWRPAAADRAVLVAGTVPTSVPSADRPAAETAMRRAYLDGFRAVMLLSALIAFGSAAIALRLPAFRVKAEPVPHPA
jgi:EmrB/QacA subfamily drug resistance transporter